MNTILRAKIETCLELSKGKTGKDRAKDFKKNVLMVTNMSPTRFDEVGITADSYRLLQEGAPRAYVLETLF